MGEKDDGLGLGLSLSLGCGSNGSRNNTGSQEPSSKNLNLMQKPNNNPMQYHLQHQKTRWNDIFQLSSERRSSDAVSFLRGLDVNNTPVPTTECEDDNGASSPNSTVSSLSGKRSERSEPMAGAGEEEAEEGERDSCSRGSDDEDGAGGDNCRKKLRLTKEQSLVLEETFKDHNTLNPKQKLALAKQLNLRPRQVEVWFQNRRARTKLKQTEVDCEYLKRCCENLTEENRRLQKEVQELRALKLSPQLYMQMSPPTTLTMCPSCERVSSSSAGPCQPARGPHCRPNWPPRSLGPNK